MPNTAKMYNNSSLSAILEKYIASQVFVIADSKVAVDLPYPTLRIESSEANKSLASAERIWQFLAEHGATRQAVVVNIGGGMICDLGGFAAATYMRGIDYINVPTTLLAMIDAAIGGKTGVNLGRCADRTKNTEHRLLKNYVGAFRLPKATIIDTAFLETLPPEEILSGFGEMLKTGLLHGEKTFAAALQALDQFYDQNMPTSSRLKATKKPSLTELINTCKKYKESIVAQDPEEAGLRKVLNFGHTVGHAIEEHGIQTAAQTEHRQHGYCVVWGMVAELYLSVVLLGCPRELLTQMSHVAVEYFGRPECNCKQQSELVALMRQDKKNATSGAINFTLLRNAGDPIINQIVEPPLIEEALDYLFSL